MVVDREAGLAGKPRKNGYADYIFFQYLARKYDAQTIKAVFDASTDQASVEAVEAALAPKGGMRTVWPEFALTLWNDASTRTSTTSAAGTLRLRPGAGARAARRRAAERTRGGQAEDDRRRPAGRRRADRSRC
jgi:hypothetical protein